MRRTLLPRMVFLLSAALAAAPLAGACESVEEYHINCDLGGPADALADAGGGDAVATPDSVADAGGEDAGTGEKVVGAPCTADDECPTEWCATTESVTDLLRRDYAVPDGLCTVLFCASDRSCGGGAACRDAGGFRMCAETCTAYQDCRYAEGWACDGDDGGPAACIPQAGLAAAKCGDGVCDESERYGVAAACPGDCPEPPALPYTTGGPCDADEDCVTSYCLTAQVLAGFGLDGEVPGGYCSSNPLVNPCTADADCGDGGICADASALAGLPVKLCLHSCADDGDCRYAEGYRCFAAGEGADAAHGCLPNGLIVAIRCGDGTCDPSEALHPEICDAAGQEDCQ